MSISTDEVAKVAGLARLNLKPEKLEQFAGQFNDILGYMEKLNELDTSGVEPLFSPVNHETVFRDDDVRQEYSREEILANAPETDGSYFIVPRIVG
ncbi:aspartyl/glutamyl-tRNA(Asn/Gln) amidotransferase subunit C [Desulfonatronum thiosulfatophilum]|uniref:Aspartyl/glutamyl-tRNA(Asn/Gln) amidotransferase subunit C n=1 Tax=Desulfonatronum thiosulfatophilum TaxID=617002 RepID=A0A1G6CBF7_9BACT|nr:Asp-tRNA(Asn)/Glu-tRNA(Gln) amidotransferase subunit GatC [Desulfonatronum thiosulfatophilum]SDB30238.1 aspartyl/glutamyl-tRNA(Asn/Gln) amidotransferase subunit C [Desulfonatronum thiosulfatophilum]